ncbi:MAG: UDP-glucose 4-epimerase GalE [Gammaproteobacteria bacterium TMED112]|nr:MAG: UDP-glucose 4-epimerase GalE [Gammaproteobacteria bacterium TMED112]|tara:strand:- start:11280 stop:12284 length:1005 start_codon:yes stop_codon:yes gene_type:complete
MKILVTGGAGYIGGTFAYEALKNNHKVLALDNFSNSKPEQIDNLKNIFEKNFEFFEIDLSIQSEQLSNCIKEFKPDVIVHFAGLKAVGESQKHPIKYWNNNVVSSINLIEAMAHNEVKKLIFSSSATVYGDSDQQPIPETAEIKSMSVYGSTKIAVERMFSEAARVGVIDVVSLRYFNPVGAHKEKIIYENPFDLPNNLMPRIIRVALGIDEELQILGDDYETRDGSGERDYIHILDLIAGHFSAIEFILKNNGESIFNLGTGVSTSVYELIKTFESTNSIKIPYRICNRRPGDVAKCYADPKLALNELNWQAEYDLSEMCKDAWLGVKDNESG